MLRSSRSLPVLALLSALAAVLLTALPAGAAQAPDSSGRMAQRSGRTWYLRSVLTSGPSTSHFDFGLATDKPVMGDWNRDGLATPGSYRAGVWYLRDVNGNGVTKVVHFGIAGDVPVVGDWNGDGRDTIGVFRNGVWYQRDANGRGPSARIFRFGLAGDVPVAGDWNGDGKDSVGVFRNGVFYLRDANSSGPARSFRFGLAGDKPVAADWDGNGTDTAGVNRGADWYLRNANSAGPSKHLVFGGTGADALAWTLPKPRPRCDPHYPTICVPPPPPDLDCSQIRYHDFKVLPPDPHNFDGKDNDGIGCETKKKS
jgi:hypothetical protein